MVVEDRASSGITHYLSLSYGFWFSFGKQVSAAGYDRQGVADHANNLATKIRNNLTNSMKAIGVDILTGFGSVLVSTQ